MRYPIYDDLINRRERVRLVKKRLGPLYEVFRNSGCVVSRKVPSDVAELLHLQAEAVGLICDVIRRKLTGYGNWQKDAEYARQYIRRAMLHAERLLSLEPKDLRFGKKARLQLAALSKNTKTLKEAVKSA